MEDNTMRLS